MADKTLCCRFCAKEYKGEGKNKEPRHNLFKNKTNSVCLYETLKNLGINVKNTNAKSETICRSCHSKLKTVEKGNEIKNQWCQRLKKETLLKRPLNVGEEDEENRKRPRIDEGEETVRIIYFSSFAIINSIYKFRFMLVFFFSLELCY